jgi:uncharacterized protein (TIGR02231 family)
VFTVEEIMKHRSILVAVALIGVAADAATDVSTRISSVTVYADRARVHRACETTLSAGSSELTIAGLPGWIDDDSVRAALSPAAAGQIADVRVSRTYLARSGDEEIRKAEAAVREIEDQVLALRDEEKTQEARQKQVADIKVFAMDKLPKDAAAGVVSIDAYGKTVDFVTETTRSIAAKRREIARELRDLQPELDARQRRLAELRQKQQLEQSTITVTVEAAAAAKVRLEVDYMTPGAAWEPFHELRSSGPRPEKVAMISYALVSQTTGEDWSGAELTFSTQSPDTVMRVPELAAMRLDAPELAAGVAKASSFSRAKMKFSSANVTYNAIVNNAAADYTGNLDRQGSVQSRVTEVFTELQEKRGTTAHFTGEGRPLVQTDGRPVRVRIGQVELPAAPLIIAAPEISLSASHTVDMTNSGRQPLLPGRVAIFSGGAFLGTTDIKFVAEGEKFTALMGVADRIKLSRVLDRRNSSLVSGGERKRMQVAFDVTVENLGAEPAQVRLLDRIPVSETKEIRVSSVDIKPDGKPDDKGLLTWNLALRPAEKKTYRIAYVLEYPVVIVAPSDMQQGAPAAPMERLRMQIHELEGKF